MAIPAGTKYYIPITVNHVRIYGTLPYFLYQINLSSTLAADALFKSFILSADSVAIYDPVGDVELDRYVILSLSSNQLKIYFCDTASTVEDRTFYVCVGQSISRSNSATPFTLSGYPHYYGKEESGSVITDYAGANDGSLQGTSSLGHSGQFGLGAINGSNGRIDLGTVPEIRNANKWTLEFLLKRMTSDFCGFFSYQPDANNYFALSYNTTVIQAIFNLAGSASSVNILKTHMPLGSFCTFVLTIDLTAGPSWPNVASFYIDGVAKTLNSSSGTPPANTPNIDHSSYLGYDPVVGAYNDPTVRDEFGFQSNIMSTAFRWTRHNQFFEGDFWDVGTGVLMPTINGDVYYPLNLTFTDDSDLPEVVVIPFQDLPSFVEEIELDDVPLRLKFRWNDHGGYWILDIHDAEDDPIVYGLKLVIGLDLIGKYRLPELPSGQLMVVNPSGGLAEIGYDDFLNERGLQLVYVRPS